MSEPTAGGYLASPQFHADLFGPFTVESLLRPWAGWGLFAKHDSGSVLIETYWTRRGAQTAASRLNLFLDQHGRESVRRLEDGR